MAEAAQASCWLSPVPRKTMPLSEDPAWLAARLALPEPATVQETAVWEILSPCEQSVVAARSAELDALGSLRATGQVVKQSSRYRSRVQTRLPDQVC